MTEIFKSKLNDSSKYAKISKIWDEIVLLYSRTKKTAHGTNKTNDKRS